jgi:hypothetical protein
MLIHSVFPCTSGSEIFKEFRWDNAIKKVDAFYLNFLNVSLITSITKVPPNREIMKIVLWVITNSVK